MAIFLPFSSEDLQIAGQMSLDDFSRNHLVDRSAADGFYVAHDTLCYNGIKVRDGECGGTSWKATSSSVEQFADRVDG